MKQLVLRAGLVILGLFGLMMAYLPSSAVLAKTAKCNGDFTLANGIECAAPGGSRGDFEGQTGIFATIINVLIFVTGALSLILIVIGGLRYVVSGGDPAGTKSAKDTIMYALIGLAVSIGAYAIANFIIKSF